MSKKKTINSSTVAKIKELMPEGEDIPENIEQSADALDRLEVWADFKNSPVGQKFLEEIETYCSAKMVNLFNNYESLSSDILRSRIAELNAVLHITNNIKKSTKQYSEIQIELDKEVKMMFEIINSVSNRGA